MTSASEQPKATTSKANEYRHHLTMFNEDKEPPDSASYDRCLDFAVKLCKAAWASTNGEENLIISPLSAESALCAVYLAAADQSTKDQAGAVLGLSNDVHIDHVVNSSADALQYLTTCAETLRTRVIAEFGPEHSVTEPAIEFTFANAVFVHKPDDCHCSVMLDEGLINLTPLIQKTDLQIRSFDGATGGHAHTINDYVMKITNSRLPDLISQKDWKAESKSVVLVNAIHLKAEFALGFCSIGHQSKNNIFTLDDGSCSRTEIMKEKMPCVYGVVEELGGAEMLRLEYGDGECRLFILLPNKKGEVNTVGKLIAQLTGKILKKAIKNLGYEIAKIELPRVRVEQAYDMIPVFRAMGLTSVFVHPVCGCSQETLMVGHAFQKTNLGIEPTGTEVFPRIIPAMECCSLPGSWGGQAPINFHAVHPFCVFVQHLETGVILYAGAVCTSSGGASTPDTSCTFGWKLLMDKAKSVYEKVILSRANSNR